MGKKSRLRRQREKKESEKEVAYQKDLELQSNSETRNLRRAIRETDCECPEDIDYEQVGQEASKRDTKYGWEETRNLYGRRLLKRR